MPGTAFLVGFSAQPSRGRRGGNTCSPDQRACFDAFPCGNDAVCIAEFDFGTHQYLDTQLFKRASRLGDQRLWKGT